MIMTMVADTLYSMLAGKLRGFEHCDAAKVYRQLVLAGRTIRSSEIRHGIGCRRKFLGSVMLILNLNSNDPTIPNSYAAVTVKGA